jgi:colicin import membrane protein
MHVVNKGQFTFEDPETFQKFEPQARTEAQKETAWLNGQIEAGAFEKTLSDRQLARADIEAEAKAQAEADAAAKAEADAAAKAEADAAAKAEADAAAKLVKKK